MAHHKFLKWRVYTVSDIPKSSGKCHIIVVICKHSSISWSDICLLFVLIFLYSLNNPRNNQILILFLNVLHQISFTCLYNRWQICAILNSSPLMTGKIFWFEKFFMYETETKIQNSTSVIYHRERKLSTCSSTFSILCSLHSFWTQKNINICKIYLSEHNF